MTHWRVAFPMYVLPQMQADMCSLWHILRTRLAQGGVDGLPQEPEFSDPLSAGIVPSDLFMLQYCGYPYVTEWQASGKLVPFACLHYDAPYCEGKMHRSVIVVRKDSAIHSLNDINNHRVAINGYDSNTGMNLLRRKLARQAAGSTLFSTVKVTGAHLESLRLVVDSRADIAAIDCVTFAFIGDYLPELTNAVRVVDVTADSPALPLFVPAHVPEAIREKLYVAWDACFAEGGEANALLRRLRMKNIERISDADLQVIADYQLEAAEMGYPILA